jgi:hypothetical protein
MRINKLLYLLTVPLYVVDWFLVLGGNVLEIVSNSVKDIILVLNSHINAPKKPPVK